MLRLVARCREAQNLVRGCERGVARGHAHDGNGIARGFCVALLGRERLAGVVGRRRGDARARSTALGLTEIGEREIERDSDIAARGERARDERERADAHECDDLARREIASARRLQ